MIHFDFSLDVINQVIKELDQAEIYIRIAIFQLHNQAVFDVLNKKLIQGISVEIFTLPYDSINEDVRERVTDQFMKLEENGAKLNFCRWNIGDPERTTTAVGRWYSYHGKFIVTDKSAISLSANFIDQEELDSILIFRGDDQKIVEFNEQFDQLLKLFIFPAAGYDGQIRTMIQNSSYPDPAVLFELPRVIESDTHVNHWIKDYPMELCPVDLPLSDGIYICPFDFRARDIVQNIIVSAEKYLYISTESFTDPDIVNCLVKGKLSGIDLKILTGASSMDFSDRMQKMLRNLLASGISIKTTDEYLHAKLMITEQVVVVSSINLNKMNLGFKRSAQLWRGNTETITILSDNFVIEDATKKFLSLFSNSQNIEKTLASKIERDVSTIFIHYFDLRSQRDVKELFSRYILAEEINVKKTILQIGKISSALMASFDRKTVTRDDFLMALILHFLSDNKLRYEQIESKLLVLNERIDLGTLLSNLEEYNYVELENDYYKLQVLSLF